MDYAEVCRRAGGRRRYNKERGQIVAVRRWQIRLALLCCHYRIDTRWIEAQAVEHRVSLATLYRDLRALDVRRSIQVRAEVCAAARERAQRRGWISDRSDT